MVGRRNVRSAGPQFLERGTAEPRRVDPCYGLGSSSARIAHVGIAAAGLGPSRAPERRRFLHMIVERRAGLRRHLLEWMGRKGGIPMGEDCVAAEPRQICSRLLPGRHFVFAFMEWSVRRGKPYELARLVGVRPAAFPSSSRPCGSSSRPALVPSVAKNERPTVIRRGKRHSASVPVVRTHWSCPMGSTRT